ncbi:hypothetical protein BDW62DRAFT_218758 [Aspergillus aurantiobrunneus]
MTPNQIAPVACDRCRLARRRCDRIRPQCSSCASQNTECVYRHASDPQPSQLVQELARIRERLESLAPLISPPLSLKSPHLMQVFGLPSDFTSLLYRLESRPHIAGVSTKLTHPGPLDTIDIVIVRQFYDHVQRWYPVLDRDFTLQCFEPTSASPSSTKSCLSLLVASIALLGDDQLRSSYFDAALSLLPVVFQEYSITSIQCLILFSIYYASLLQPRHAYDYIQAAFLKVRPAIKGAFLTEDSSEWRLLTRLYWIIYLLERHVSLHLNLPAIGKALRTHLQTIPLPTDTDLWDYIRDPNPSARSSSSTEPQNGKAYSPQDARQPHSIISTDVPSIWNEHSPSSEERHSNHSIGSMPIMNPGLSSHPQDRTSPSDAGAVYQAKSHLYAVSTYWPAIYRIIMNGVAEPELLAQAPLFFESVTGFLDTAHIALRVCPPKAWSLCASMYITAVAAIRATEVHCLRILPQPRLWESVENSVDALHRLSELSPSLQFMRDSLEDQRARVKGTHTL